MIESFLPKGLLKKLTIAGSVTFVAASIALAAGRKLLKAARCPRRSTKLADGLSMAAFDLACSNGVTFREARQQLEHSVAATKAELQGSGEPRFRMTRAFQSLKLTLTPRATF
jgi:hypothetical protein